MDVPFKLNIGGLNANAKYAIEQAFKSNNAYRKSDSGYKSGFNDMGKSGNPDTTAFYDHYGRPASGLGAPSVANQNTPFADGKFYDFDTYFQYSCGVNTANDAARGHCNEDL